MKPLEYTFDLDFLDKTSQIFCNVRQGDNCSKLVVSLRENGEAYHIEDNTSIVFAAKKPDDNDIYDDNCEVVGNKIVYHFTDQTAPASGMVLCQFILIADSDSENAYQLSTPLFRLEVSDNVDVDQHAIVESETFYDLSNAIAEASNLSATVTKSGSTATISITDRDGTTHTATVSDGAKGDKGDKGDDRVFYSINNPPSTDLSSIYSLGDVWINRSVGSIFLLSSKAGAYCTWNRVTQKTVYSQGDPPLYETRGNDFTVLEYEAGDIWIRRHLVNSGSAKPIYVVDDIYVCVGSYRQSTSPTNRYNITWSKLARAENTYTKTEIDAMIGDIGSAIDTLNGNIDTLNTNLSEV